uniref:C2H2-type domain-containing protein n=1 Tax=Setaria digitata TaxID=48799 RepID=A0A915PY42_9BILA
MEEPKYNQQKGHAVMAGSSDSSESVSVVADVQEIALEGSDDECPVLINEKALQESIESGTLSSMSHLRSSKVSDDGRWQGRNPLQKFSILIGSNKLTFKIHRNDFAVDDLICQKNENETHNYFGDGSLWSDHEISVDRPIYRCKICGRAYAHKRPLLAHEKTHATGQPYQCPICTKYFARQVNFRIHMKLHASGRRYFCSLCGKWFRTQSLMFEHQQKCLAMMNGLPVLTDRPLRYRCYYCDKMFHHRRDKNIHERTHTGERPYTCGYCSKGFTQSQALTIHIRSHTGERPYVCSICSKEFRDSSALRKHEFTKHMNENLPDDDYSGSSSEIALISTPYVI